jgi:hypothetical protein
MQFVFLIVNFVFFVAKLFSLTLRHQGAKKD